VRIRARSEQAAQIIFPVLRLRWTLSFGFRQTVQRVGVPREPRVPGVALRAAALML